MARRRRGSVRADHTSGIRLETLVGWPHVWTPLDPSWRCFHCCSIPPAATTVYHRGAALLHRGLRWRGESWISYCPHHHSGGYESTTKRRPGGTSGPKADCSTTCPRCRHTRPSVYYVLCPQLYNSVRVVTSIVKSDHKAIIAYPDQSTCSQPKSAMK